MKEKVLVLGAGLQGILVALQLHRQGYQVEVLDKASAPLSRASLRNEGKIHTGIIYVKDKSFNSARKILAGALTFSDGIEEITGTRAPWQQWYSKPFVYLAMADSMLSPNQLNECYQFVNELFLEGLKSGQSYLGSQHDFLVRPLTTVPDYLKILRAKLQRSRENSDQK